MKIAVLGAGAWGTAMAHRLASHGEREVWLWARDARLVEHMQAHRSNPRLPGIALAASLRFGAEARAALDEADLVLLGAPVAATVELAQLPAQSCPTAPVLSLAKGFVPDANGKPQLVHEAMTAVGCQQPGLLSGPSFASETAQGLPLALVCALPDAALSQRLAQQLRDPALRIYAGSDRIGIALCGALKNVYAIGAGVSDGLGLGANARAAMVTRALAELRRLVLAAGGQAETVFGLAGVGDLVLTTGGDASRNRQVGLALARGEALPDIVARLGHVAEGVAAAPRALAYAEALGVELPIAAALAALLAGRLDAPGAIRLLLEREAGREF